MLKKWLFCFLIGICIIGIGGCGMTENKEEVRTVLENYWAYAQAQEYDKAEELCTEDNTLFDSYNFLIIISYENNLFNKIHYEWFDPKIVDVKFKGNTAIVNVEILFCDTEEFAENLLRHIDDEIKKNATDEELYEHLKEISSMYLHVVIGSYILEKVDDEWKIDGFEYKS